MKIKWYGTATILLEQDGIQLLFDPFLSRNNKGFVPPLDELSAMENILITHGHFDHTVDIPVILKHGKGKTTVYCTEKPREALMLKGVEEKHIQKINPGDILNLGPFTLRVLKGKHIIFNKALVVKTFLSPRVLIYRNNLKYMLKENKNCAEAGETVAYNISTTDKRILLMGSLNLDCNTEYPKGMDLLIMPLQGRSGIANYSLQFIDRLQPKKVLLDHFDNTFPPISSAVKTTPFISLMQKKYSGIPVICPQASAEWIDVGWQ